MQRRSLIAAGAAVLAAALPLAALAQTAATALTTWPSQPVKIIVPTGAGSSLDLIVRLLSHPLAARWGQPVVVDNKPGAGGMLGLDIAAKATDGHTIAIGFNGPLAYAPFLYAKTPYDPVRDLKAIVMTTSQANVLAINTERVPAKTLAEYVTLAKDKPGTVTQASSGIGGAGHLAGELLKIRAGIDAIHVAYKGGGPGMLAVMGGEVNAYYATPVSAGAQIKNGKVRALATTGLKRDRLLPDVPTVAESGYPGYEATNWYAYVVPAKTPAAVVTRLNQSLVKTLNLPEVVAALHKQGLDPSPSTPAELAAFMQREYDTWGKVVKQAGIKAE